MLAPHEFIESHWDDIMSDLSRLICVPSVANPDAKQPGAPYGPDARVALDTIHEMLHEKGFDALIDEGYIAICDIPGESEQQLGVVGHLDVVPAGPGWNTDPFTLTERDGWLLGRGVTDDKGPMLVTLWALLYWCEIYDVAHGGRLPHPVRFIFGSDEEIASTDMDYFRAHHEEPTFLFTPDAGFPVCYGEKGMLGITVRSAHIPADERRIVELSAGTATNAVPGEAYAVVQVGDARKRLESHGMSAHASTPERGESALKMLVGDLLEEGALSEAERHFLEAAFLVAQDFYGESLGIAAQDEAFGRLTGVAGTLRLEDDQFVLTYDVRYPQSVTGEELSVLFHEALKPWADCVHIEVGRTVEPFLLDADSAPISALINAFNEVTGLDMKPFTMGGATYARGFKNACSFGMENHSMVTPSWVGGMHGPNEGVPADYLKVSMEIYIAAFGKLFEVDLA